MIPKLIMQNAIYLHPKKKMPATKDFAYRIEILDECLRNKNQKWTLNSLLNKINDRLFDQHGKQTSKRTLQNDLRYLIEEKDAPIVSSRDGNTTYFAYSDYQFSIKNLPIDREEIQRLRDALTILKQVSDFSILAEVETIIGKLEKTIEGQTNNGSSIIQFENNNLTSGMEYLSSLYDGIKTKNTLRISYQPFRSEHCGEFIFHPYLLKEYRNRWFVIGLVEGNMGVTCFALDRIRNLKTSSHIFRENTIFDPETWFNNAIGVSIPYNAEVEEIFLKIGSSQAPYVLTKPLHSSQELIRRFKDGSIRVKIRVIINYELKAVLLSFGADLRVESPLGLQMDIKNILENARCLYAAI